MRRATRFLWKRPRLQLHQLRRDIAAEERRLRKATMSAFGFVVSDLVSRVVSL